jgi:hypothetical protein
MKGQTIAIIAIVIIVVLIIGGYISINIPGGEKLPGQVFSGRLKVNLVETKRIDGSAYTVTSTQMRMLHGSMDYNDKVGTITSASITGDVSPADKGYWYLVIDYGTNNTCWLDLDETGASKYVSRIFGSDGDKDGFDEEYVELFFGNVEPQLGLVSEVEVTLVYDAARTSSIAWTSLTNGTGITTTAYAYSTSTGYTTGFTEGDMAKIAKVELDFSSSGNTTYPDLEYWKLTHLKLGPYTWTAANFGSYDLANTRYQVIFGDQINHAGGRELYYAKNAGDLWASYELKCYAKYPAAGQIWCTIKVFVYKPDGSMTTAFERITSFVGT